MYKEIRLQIIIFHTLIKDDKVSYNITFSILQKLNFDVISMSILERSVGSVGPLIRH